MKEEISANDLKRILKDNKDVILIDVRSRQEYMEGHLSGSISIPSYEISQKIQDIVKNKNAMIVVYCQYGTRGMKAVNTLKKLGYTNIYNLKKGLEGIRY